MKKLITLALCIFVFLSLLSGCKIEAAAAPWVGLWRNADHKAVSLYSINEDGTFNFQIFSLKSVRQAVSGKYKVSGNKITMSDRVYEGNKVGDVELTLEIIGSDTLALGNERCDRVPEKDAAALLANPTTPYNSGGMSATAEYYILGNDRIPSVMKAVGLRNVVKSDTKIVDDDVTIMLVVYWTDPNDMTQAANDMAKYFQYLLANDDFLSLKAFDGLPYDGGVEMKFAKNSVDDGKIIILNIDYSTTGYSLEFTKGKGTLTKSN